MGGFWLVLKGGKTSLNPKSKDLFAKVNETGKSQGRETGLKVVSADLTPASFEVAGQTCIGAD